MGSATWQLRKVYQCQAWHILKIASVVSELRPNTFGKRVCSDLNVFYSQIDKNFLVFIYPRSGFAAMLNPRQFETREGALNKWCGKSGRHDMWLLNGMGDLERQKVHVFGQCKRAGLI
jgi:hypothetical protein